MASWASRRFAAWRKIRGEQTQAELEHRMAEIEENLRLSWPDGVTPAQHIVAARVIAESHLGHLSPSQINWLDKNPERSDLILGGPYGGLLPRGRSATHHRQHERERRAPIKAPRELDVAITPETGRPAESTVPRTTAPWPDELHVLRRQEGLVYGTVSLDDPELTRLVVDVSGATGSNPPAVPEGAYEQLRTKWSRELGAPAGKTGALAVTLHRPPADEVTPNALLDLFMTLAQHAPQASATLHLPAELIEYAGRCNAARHQHNYDYPKANLAQIFLAEQPSAAVSLSKDLKPPSAAGPQAPGAVPPRAFPAPWRPPAAGPGAGSSLSQN